MGELFNIKDVVHSTDGSEVILDKYDVGLSEVDNTSDLDKPISKAVKTELSTKSNINHSHEIAQSVVVNVNESDGINDIIIDLSLKSNFYIELAFKSDAVPNFQHIFSIFDTKKNALTPFIDPIDANFSKPTIGYMMGTTGDSCGLYNGNFNVGKFTHTLFIKEANICKIYINGKLRLQDSISITTDADAKSILRLFNDLTGLKEFKGSINKLCIGSNITMNPYSRFEDWLKEPSYNKGDIISLDAQYLIDDIWKDSYSGKSHKLKVLCNYEPLKTSTLTTQSFYKNVKASETFTIPIPIGYIVRSMEITTKKGFDDLLPVTLNIVRASGDRMIDETPITMLTDKSNGITTEQMGKIVFDSVSDASNVSVYAINKQSSLTINGCANKIFYVDVELEWRI